MRTPTENALSMAGLARIAAPFRRSTHREFVLLSVLPALAAAKLGAHPRWQTWQRRLAAYDRHLFTACPVAGTVCVGNGSGAGEVEKGREGDRERGKGETGRQRAEEAPCQSVFNSLHP